MIIRPANDTRTELSKSESKVSTAGEEKRTNKNHRIPDRTAHLSLARSKYRRPVQLLRRVAIFQSQTPADVDVSGYPFDTLSRQVGRFRVLDGSDEEFVLARERHQQHIESDVFFYRCFDALSMKQGTAASLRCRVSISIPGLLGNPNRVRRKGL